MSAARGRTSRRAATRVAWIALLVMAVAPACAGDIVRYEHAGRERIWLRERGYSIDRPQRARGADWRERALGDADLAFEGPDGAALSLQSSCRKRRASPQMLARHLTLGSSGASLLGSGPVELRGDSGWAQTFETREHDVLVRVKTVSLVGGGCVFDWVLVTPDPSTFAELEAILDAWWQSFRRGVTADPRRVPEEQAPEASLGEAQP